MPVNQKDNKKNAPQSKRDSALVPKKESAGKSKPAKTSPSPIPRTPTNALSTVGKRKTPSNK